MSSGVDAALARVDALEGWGRTDDARREAARAVAAFPDEARTHCRLAQLLTDPAERFAEAREGLRLAPDWPHAQVLCAVYDPDDHRGLEAMRQVVARHPEDADHQLVLAWLALQAEGPSRATWALAERVVELAPGDADAHLGVAQLAQRHRLVLTESRSRDIVREHVARTLELDPDNEGALRLQAEYSRGAKEARESARGLFSALEDRPTSVDLHAGVESLVQRVVGGPVVMPTLSLILMVLLGVGRSLGWHRGRLMGHPEMVFFATGTMAMLCAMLAVVAVRTWRALGAGRHAALAAYRAGHPRMLADALLGVITTVAVLGTLWLLGSLWWAALVAAAGCAVQLWVLWRRGARRAAAGLPDA